MVRRHFSISGTAPVCSFPLVWNVKNTETKSSFLLFSWPKKLLYACLLFGPGYSAQQHQPPELNEQVWLRFCTSSLYLLQKLFGPKGIRGNTNLLWEVGQRTKSTPTAQFYNKTNHKHVAGTTQACLPLTVLRLRKGHLDFFVSVGIKHKAHIIITFINIW